VKIFINNAAKVFGEKFDQFALNLLVPSRFFYLLVKKAGYKITKILIIKNISIHLWTKSDIFRDRQSEITGDAQVA